MALTECIEVFNRIIKQVLHRITPGYIRQLAPIVDNRKIAIDEVEHRFYKPRKARNTVETLVKDRQKSANNAANFLLDCDAFRESGKDRAISLSGMITSKAVSEAVGSQNHVHGYVEGTF